MGVTIRIRNGIIHLIIRSGGITREETTGLHVTSNRVQNGEVMRLAELLLSRREIQLIEGLTGVSLDAEKETLFSYCEKFSAEKGERFQIYKALPYFERYGARDVQIGSVTSKWFERFQDNMETRSGLSAHTAEKYCSVMRQILKKAVRDGILRHDPADGIRHIRTPDSVKEFLTAEEVAMMARTPFHLPQTDEAYEDEVRRAFLFGCYTGLRISDMRQLTYEMIDVQNMRIVKQQQKTKKVVHIPLNERALKIIGIKKRGFVFPILAVSKRSEDRYIKKWAEEAGIKKNVTWHTARHTNATLLLEAGADLYTVQKILGHSKISTTAQYAQVTDKKKRDAVEALPDFSKLKKK